MQPSDIHFAAVWPTAHDGSARKVVVPFQCSLAEASKTVEGLASAQRKRNLPSGVSAIETLALGSYCVFSTPTSTPSALIVVGTKSWSCASGVFAFIRSAQADLARDPADFGYWQLRSLALRAEAVAIPPAGDDGSYAMPPRLCEEQDWDDEKSESWEDEDMWSQVVDADDGEMATPTTSDLRDAPCDDTATGISAWIDQEAKAGVLLGGNITPKQQQQEEEEQQQQQPAPEVVGLGPAMVDRRTSPVVGGGSGGSPPVSTAATPPRPTEILGQGVALFPASEERAEPRPLLDVEAAPSTPGGASGSPSPAAAAADLSLLSAPAKDGRFIQAVATGGGEPGAAVAEAVAARADAGAPAAGPGAGPEGGDPGAGVAGAAKAAAAAVSAAVSEDLAYVHRGSVLQSYAITGSVLVAASPGARARLRVTDREGHIASATSNAAVATENTASSILPTREYLCTAGAAQQPAGAPPKFLPALMYRCSPAVKVLPVRVVCRLRSAGNSVLVWAQVIANPQLSQSLSGVSVIASLPFSPRSDGVKSEPPATLKTDSRTLEWVLPLKMRPGGKQVLQARLSIDEGQPRAVLPPTAPATVKCHLLDSTFSSVELEMAAMAEDGLQAALGRVMKQCRVQCAQQG